MKWLAPVLIGGTIAIVVIAIILPDANETGRAADMDERIADGDVPGEMPASQPQVDLETVPTDGFEVAAAPVDHPPALPPAPNEDLVLTGLSGLGERPSALFAITRPGEPDARFTLHAGDQNEWLKVISIDAAQGRVKAVLNRPVVRIRKTGADVILFLNVHGKK